jgi:tetratricopeptide (TPR) repeat protein
MKTAFLIVFFLLILSSIIAILFALFSLFKRLRRGKSDGIDESQARRGNERSVFSANKAAEYYADLGRSTDGKLKELFEQAMNFKRKRRLLEATRAFEQCLDEDATPMQKAGLLVALGNCHFAIDELGLAKSHYENALNLLDGSGGDRGRLACLVNLGLVCAANREYSQAISNYRKAIELDRQLNYPKGEAIDLNSLALTYETSGDSENALKCYNASLLIFENLDDRQRMEIVKRNIRELEGKAAPNRPAPNLS